MDVVSVVGVTGSKFRGTGSPVGQRFDWLRRVADMMTMFTFSAGVHLFKNEKNVHDCRSAWNLETLKTGTEHINGKSRDNR